jgi:hypothetical protein
MERLGGLWLSILRPGPVWFGKARAEKPVRFGTIRIGKFGTGRMQCAMVS